MKLIDLTGRKFGELTVIGIHSRSRNSSIRWECRCSCGSNKNILGAHLRSGKITNCGCINYSGIKQPQWTGCGDISGNYWYSLRRGANGSKGRGVLDFSISIDYAWDLFLEQERCCALSGEPLEFEHQDGVKVRSYRTASLDRINSGDGYIEGNVQWVHKDINLMKGRLEEDVFKFWCRRVAEFNK